MLRCHILPPLDPKGLKIKFLFYMGLASTLVESTVSNCRSCIYVYLELLLEVACTLR